MTEPGGGVFEGSWDIPAISEAEASLSNLFGDISLDFSDGSQLAQLLSIIGLGVSIGVLIVVLMRHK